MTTKVDVLEQFADEIEGVTGCLVRGGRDTPFYTEFYLEPLDVKMLDYLSDKADQLSKIFSGDTITVHRKGAIATIRRVKRGVDGFSYESFYNQWKSDLSGTTGILGITPDGNPLLLNLLSVGNILMCGKESKYVFWVLLKSLWDKYYGGGTQNDQLIAVGSAPHQIPVRTTEEFELVVHSLDEIMNDHGGSAVFVVGILGLDEWLEKTAQKTRKKFESVLRGGAEYGIRIVATSAINLGGFNLIIEQKEPREVFTARWKGECWDFVPPEL